MYLLKHKKDYILQQGNYMKCVPKMKILKIPLVIHLTERDKLCDEIIMLKKLVHTLTQKWKRLSP